MLTTASIKDPKVRKERKKRTKETQRGILQQFILWGRYFENMRARKTGRKGILLRRASRMRNTFLRDRVPEFFCTLQPAANPGTEKFHVPGELAEIFLKREQISRRKKEKKKTPTGKIRR